MPHALGPFGFNSGGDHRRTISPAGSKIHTQQHMSGTTICATSPARMLDRGPPIGADAMTNPPLTSEPPRAQPPATTRTQNAPTEKVTGDRTIIIIYREHQRGLYALERSGVMHQTFHAGPFASIRHRQPDAADHTKSRPHRENHHRGDLPTKFQVER